MIGNVNKIGNEGGGRLLQRITVQRPVERVLRRKKGKVKKRRRDFRYVLYKVPDLLLRSLRNTKYGVLRE